MLKHGSESLKTGGQQKAFHHESDELRNTITFDLTTPILIR